MTSAFELDRRSLLQLCGGATLALGLAGAPPSAFGAAPRRGGTVVVADQRYSESVRYSESLEGPGIEVLPLGRDLARLWHDLIVPRLTSRPFVTVGITLPADLFGFERLAEGSGAVTVAKFEIALDHAPRRGRPKHFVGWMLRWLASYRAMAHTTNRQVARLPRVPYNRRTVTIQDGAPLPFGGGYLAHY